VLLQVVRATTFLTVASFLVWIAARERRAADSPRQVIDAIPVMAWSFLPEGKIDFLNHRWLEYTGLTMKAALADPMGSVHPDDRAGAMERWRQNMASGNSYEQELRLRRADGEYRWFLVRTVSVRDDEGQIVRWYGTSTDIEDRKRAAKAMHETQEQ